MGSMHLAMGQAPVVLGDIEKNLEIMEEIICEAQRDSKKNIDLIVFPELFITGYNLSLLYTSPSPRDRQQCRMPSSA